MDTLTIVIIVWACLVTLAAAYLMAPVHECPECLHCSAERRRKAEKQRELRHDAEHHGWHGAMVDVFDCTDPKCPRNKR